MHGNEKQLHLHLLIYLGNVGLLTRTLRAALGVLPFVVALIAYHGGELIPTFGTIIESYDNTIIVLTSANLLRRHTSRKLGENVLADNLKVYAHSFDGHSYTVGEVCAHDFHYNLVVLKFISKTPSLPHLQPAKFVKLAHEDDDLVDTYLSGTRVILQRGQGWMILSDLFSFVHIRGYLSNCLAPGMELLFWGGISPNHFNQWSLQGNIG
uniref:Uncharacterized protein n=1 Tax=Daucus carota subsp. sativus TaxID=79200 RepID=A0A166AJD8_DAUCS